jgi:hypothetical protein
MAILMISSVVMASPNGRSAKSSTTQTDGAIWGSDGAIWGGGGCRVQGCLNQAVKTTQSPVHTSGRTQPNEQGLFHGIWQSIETAIWGFVPPPTR